MGLFFVAKEVSCADIFALSACDQLEREPFDLVLLDIMLPGADGYEVLNTL